MRIQLCITSIFLAASLVSLVTGSATAQLNLSNPNSLLQGTYRYTMIETCSRSGEFTALPDLQPIGGGDVVTQHVTGLITYDGLGHAAVNERGIAIFPGPYPIGEQPVTIGPIVFDRKRCDWTYTVKWDRTFTQGGDCKGFDKYGPEEFGIPGEEVIRTNIQLEGQIGSRGRVLIWNQGGWNGGAPPIQTLSTNTGFFTKQVCGYSGTAVRVGGTFDD
ncbi:MAG: hypothetical protein ACREIJ_13345 [Nitrospiraceae bacterium]